MEQLNSALGNSMVMRYTSKGMLHEYFSCFQNEYEKDMYCVNVLFDDTYSDKKIRAKEIEFKPWQLIGTSKEHRGHFTIIKVNEN